MWIKRSPRAGPAGTFIYKEEEAWEKLIEVADSDGAFPEGDGDCLHETRVCRGPLKRRGACRKRVSLAHGRASEGEGVGKIQETVISDRKQRS